MYLRNRLVRSVAALAATAVMTTGALAAGADEPPLYGWTQYNAAGLPVIRVVVATASCPHYSDTLGGGPMTLRVADAPTGFEGIFVCEAALGSGAQDIMVGDLTLPAPIADPQRVVVLGDTGCRVKGTDVQNCTGAGTGPAWNFQALAEAAAQDAPQLVIHVGDLHYREFTDECGLNCLPENIGFTWKSWEVDFFEPAKTLLATAPWIIVRGNHENCSRAWRGWFLFFDPRPAPAVPWPVKDCLTNDTAGAAAATWLYTNPYAIGFAQHQVVVMDSSYIEEDYTPTPEAATVARYAKEFDTVEAMASAASTPSWVVTHRPFWAVSSDLEKGKPDADLTDVTLQAALAASQKSVFNDQISLVMAGHVHLFEKLSFTDGRPPQLVFGGGGTELSPALSGVLAVRTASILQDLGVAKEDFVSAHNFGYGVMQSQSGGWLLDVKTAQGKPSLQFSFPR